MQEIFNTFDSLSDACRYYKFPINGSGLRKIKSIISENNIDISHFTNGTKKKIKYERIIKNCPVCDKEFETIINHPHEKKTCSYACSNTYFRTGVSNPNYRGNNYRTIMRLNHPMECIVCGENKIVECHHYDENHNNNEPSNLIPLCPTHHQYIHSRYKDEVMGIIEEYRKNSDL